jgi:peptide/nickel transport system permease protein
MIGLIVFTALAAPVFSPPGGPLDSPGFKRVGPATDRIPRPSRPGAPLGTDGSQFDVLHTVLWGTRSALRFGLLVALASSVVGVLIGAVAGYAGGRINALALRVADAFLAFPVLAGLWLFALILSPEPGSEGISGILQDLVARLDIPPLMVALICFSWMPYMRLVNANVRRLKDGEVIIAARSLGVSTPRLLLRHLLPAAISPAVVLLARDVGLAVVTQANFAFIGLDGSSPWGVMLAANRNWVIGLSGNPFLYWWAFVPITLAVIFFATAWNLAGDSLNDALNPRRAR